MKKQKSTNIRQSLPLSKSQISIVLSHLRTSEEKVHAFQNSVELPRLLLSMLQKVAEFSAAKSAISEKLLVNFSLKAAYRVVAVFFTILMPQIPKVFVHYAKLNFITRHQQQPKTSYL